MTCKNCCYFIPLSACQISPLEVSNKYSCDKETNNGVLIALKKEIEKEFNDKLILKADKE